MAEQREPRGSDRSVETGAALWHGRFESSGSAALAAYTHSISVDRRLWFDDLTASRVHVEMLGHTGILAPKDVEAILSALTHVHDEMSAGSFQFETGDEDIHTAIERRVTQIAGPAGARLHTGRSRNDQVVTALKLWSKREMGAIGSALLNLVDIFMERADESDACNPPIRLPGYTHLQRAQSVLLSHHLRAHCWAILRDVDRLVDAIERADVSPLGAGAVGGSSLPLDPSFTAQRLGFPQHFANSLDAVSDRDFVSEYLFVLAMVGVHLSRIGEEWVLWTSDEFSFAVVDDAFATGSSMLPQKKNPDIAELARGKSGRLIGNLTSLLIVLKGLPLAYNRDLQEDKEPLFDSVDHVRRGLEAVAGMVATTVFRGDTMAEAADGEALVAVDLAECLVARGMPFREAHALVGESVRRSLDEGCALSKVVADDHRYPGEAHALFAPGSSLSRRVTAGSPGPGPSTEQRSRLIAVRDRMEQRLKNYVESGQ